MYVGWSDSGRWQRQIRGANQPLCIGDAESDRPWSTSWHQDTAAGPSQSRRRWKGNIF